MLMWSCCFNVTLQSTLILLSVLFYILPHFSLAFISVLISLFTLNFNLFLNSSFFLHLILHCCLFKSSFCFLLFLRLVLFLFIFYLYSKKIGNCYAISYIITSLKFFSDIYAVSFNAIFSFGWNLHFILAFNFILF